MSQCDQLREMLIAWAEKHYLPLMIERNRYRETAQKYLLKSRRLEKEVQILKFKLQTIEDEMVKKG